MDRDVVNTEHVTGLSISGSIYLLLYKSTHSWPCIQLFRRILAKMSLKEFSVCQSTWAQPLMI